MMEFPYGIADFRRIRQQGLVYVDRTGHIRDGERLGSILVFLRPRRFGKSLWLQTLANYYDLRRAGEFGEIFGGLAIGENPTPNANRYFVLQWNFSTVDPGGSVGEIAENLREHVCSRAKNFAADYEGFLPAAVECEGSSAAVLESILRVVRQTPYKLYLLIDEYDNFINEVMVRDIETYEALIEADGPYKQLFKSVKSATEGQGMERVFVTGVSPVALNDLTSGFNNAKNVSLDASLGALCGFRDEEICGQLELIAGERGLSNGDVESALDTMRTWYNGYLFTEGPPEGVPYDRSKDLVYNPINTLYFLEHLLRWGVPPTKLQDENLRTDRGKLAFLGRTSAGTGVIEKITEGHGEIKVPRLEESFSVADLTKGLEKDQGIVASFLYYLGLLTLAPSDDASIRLRVPNLVMEKLFLDRMLRVYLPESEEGYEAREIAMRFFQDGDLGPLLGFFENRLLPVLSNRDRGAPAKNPEQSGSGVNETTVKTLFLSMLFDDMRYVIHFEPELDQRYADLCLLVRPEMSRRGYFDLLFEFKLIRQNDLGKKGQELKEMDKASLRKLPKVKTAFSEARKQAAYYRAALERRYGAELDLRCYVVVMVGLVRMLGEELS